MTRKLLILISLFCSVAVGPAAAAQIAIVGSNTLEPFLRQWGGAYQVKSGGVEVVISSPGTSVAPKALISGSADLAAMNREMTNDESEAFLRAYGHYPTSIAVAIEAVALYVNPENPIKGLDYNQLDSIFASSHGCNWNDPITKWGQLGVTGTWANRSIVLLGHDKKSALRDFFDKSVLCRDGFRAGVEDLTHQQLMTKVAENKDALGYSRYDAETRLKILPLKRGGGDFVALTPANLYKRDYRLQHYLYLYLNKPAGKPVSPTILDFLKLGLSREGQAAVAGAGYFPLSDELVQRQLGKLN